LFPSSCVMQQQVPAPNTGSSTTITLDPHSQTSLITPLKTPLTSARYLSDSICALDRAVKGCSPFCLVSLSATLGANSSSSSLSLSLPLTTPSLPSSSSSPSPPCPSAIPFPAAPFRLLARFPSAAASGCCWLSFERSDLTSLSNRKSSGVRKVSARPSCPARPTGHRQDRSRAAQEPSEYSPYYVGKPWLVPNRCTGASMHTAINNQNMQTTNSVNEYKVVSR
jgi:hypothetical protein